MNPRGFYLFLSLLFVALEGQSQIIINDFKYSSKRTPERRPYWLIGIGWNAVDDNGNAFKKLFDIRKSWNIRPYPAQIWAERTRGGFVSYGGIFNFNQYRPGKIIHGKPLSGVGLFFSLDLYAKVHPFSFLGLADYLDVYIPIGAGYTLRLVPPHITTPTMNAGAGMNYWISSWLAINAQSIAKFGIKSPFFRSSSNYLQHSAGLVIRPGKMLNKRYPFIKPRYPWVHRDKIGKERIRKK